MPCWDHKNPDASTAPGFLLFIPIFLSYLAFAILPGTGHLLLWCADYPRYFLSGVFPGFSTKEEKTLIMRMVG